MATRFINVFAALLAASLAAIAQQADLIYYNGKIITMWPERPSAEAVAIAGDRFIAVGASADVLKTAGPGARRIDLHGQTVVPGLIDSHVHPIGAALSEIDGPVPVFHSIAEIQDYIRKQAKTLPSDRLIFVPKVYPSRLAERRYPTRAEMDAAAQGREAVADNGYAAVLDSALMKRLGITKDTPEPSNGRIVRDSAGNPTGLILGAPQLLAAVRTARKYTAKERLQGLKSMLAHYNAAGLTSIIDRSEGPEGFRAYQQLHDSGQLTVRAYVTYLIRAQGSPADVRQEIERFPFVTGFGDKWLRVGSLKTILDGGILIGTAYLREPWGQHTQLYGFV
ncbi:MAG TPA: amidohydrolase family protein, partial [Bryobacteraceae bacterium]|nr:amidohydrolase family protein [Bryobacteraceae bacterium]